MPRSSAGSSAATPKFFRDSAQLREWLHRNHATQTELWVGLYRKGSGKPSITWPELVDQLLCFGWIDGIRKSVNEISYANRVTPRRRGSNWSAVNLRRVAELIELGLMEPPGLAAFEGRDRAKAQRYSFENDEVSLGIPYEAEFRKNRSAWRFFAAQPPSYRRVALWWVMSAKREETQRRRLAKLIDASAEERRVT